MVTCVQACMPYPRHRLSAFRAQFGSLYAHNHYDVHIYLYFQQLSACHLIEQIACRELYTAPVTPRQRNTPILYAVWPITAVCMSPKGIMYF